MQKLLLIPLLFLITPYAKADMDYICISNMDNDTDYIAERCERNNILIMTDISMSSFNLWIARWCRHDREINYAKGLAPNSMTITCVLYDNKPRTLIPIN